MMRHRPFGVLFETGERAGILAGAWSGTIGAAMP